MKQRKEMTEEQRQAWEARKDRFRGFVKQIAAMPESARIALAEKCPITTCEGHTLSIRNQCLVAVQMPTATLAGGFQQWRKQGRSVRKGEHGFVILAPSMKKNGVIDTATGEEGEMLRFLTITLFDISQTD
jgi:hypothetical protein